MVTLTQVQNGLIRFVDQHVVGAFEGWKKVVITGAATLMVANLGNTLNAYKDLPVVAAMGVYNDKDGTIDIDAIYSAFVPGLKGEKIPIQILPKETIRLGREDFDTLIRYIKEG